MNNKTPEKTNNMKIIKDMKTKTDEHAGFYFSSFIKISDPNTKETLMQKRGDN